MTHDVIAETRRRTRQRITAVALGAAVVALLGTAAMVGLDGGSASSRQPPEAAGPHVSGDSAEPVAMPADLHWELVGGVSLPVSSQAGPRDTAGGLARGFSHDEAGAVLAAVHIVVRVAPQLGPGIFDTTLRAQVVGTDAPAMRSRVGQDYDELRANANVQYGQPVGRLEAVLRGYRMLSYSGQDASLQLLTEANDAQGNSLLAVTSVRMQWTGSDWALLAPAGGDFGTVMSRASEAAGYHAFTAGR